MFNSSIDNLGSYWCLLKVTLRSFAKMMEVQSALPCQGAGYFYDHEDKMMGMLMIADARRDHLLTEQVMTQTFLGFCFSQLCMFLHTANRLWRLGACREGQLHSDTWTGASPPRGRRTSREKRGRRERKADVSNSREDESSDGD